MANTEEKKPYWHDALAAFSLMSTWILGPIIVALFAGKWLDAKYHTTPVIFLSLTGAAFVLSFVGLIKDGKRYMQQVEDKAAKDKKDHERNEPDHN